jgi:Domain of unknown function (DUF3597)
MSIFSRIKDAIWGRSEETAEPKEIDTGAKPTVASATVVPGVAPASSPVSTSKAPSPASTSQPPVLEVDVAAILDAAVKKQRQKLNWRTSIVDLMKALELDSSLSSRKELARELGYDGDMKSSARMNIWLHKQVMQKLKENGGKVPPELQ